MSHGLAEELRLLRENAGMVDCSERRVVVVSGPEGLSFLQSLVSADLAPLTDGDGVHTLLLTPQGKLDVDFRLLRVGEEAWLVCDPGFGAQLAASLNRFRIRVKAEVEDRSDAYGCLSVRGPDALDAARALEVETPAAAHAHASWEDARVVRVEGPGGTGFDVVGPLGRIGDAREQLGAAGVAACGAEAYEALRIERGIPRQGFDLDEKTIPQEAFLEREAVSFTKGCFLGQELVCRIDTRGHVNRYLRSLGAIAGDRPPRGSEIVAGDKVVGSVTSSVLHPELPAVALGYVRREVEPPAAVTLRWDGGEAGATVEPLASVA